MDFREIVEKIGNFRNLPNYLYEREDGGIVLGSQKNQQYWLVYIDEHDYHNKPEAPYKPDFYSISTEVKFGNNYDDLIHDSARLIYQIYGLNIDHTFEIDELCKMAPDHEIFESYFRDEIFNSEAGKELSRELVQVIDQISGITYKISL